jgi:hypothetical protein
MNFGIAPHIRFAYKSSPRPFPQMTPGSFDRFFQRTLGREIVPFDSQRRLACGEPNGRSEPECLRSGTKCESKLISPESIRGDKVAAVGSAMSADSSSGGLAWGIRA